MGFGHVWSFFKPFWPIYIDVENPCKNEIWVQKSLFLTFSWKYLICGFNLEISIWKLFFRKVQIICYILAIHHVFSKCVFMELHAFESTREITLFGQNHYKNGYFWVYGNDSSFLDFDVINFIILLYQSTDMYIWKRSAKVATEVLFAIEMKISQQPGGLWMRSKVR